MNGCQENIKYLIPRPKTPVIKPPMHRSIYTESIKRAYRSNKDCHRTMGYAEVRLDPPTEFLKKHTRKVIRPFVEKTKTTSSDKKTGDGRASRTNSKVETERQQPSKGPVKKPCNNIRRANIIDVIRKVPPVPKHRVQDTRNGHVIVLDEAGLEPTYVSKKSYGKIPAYIVKMHKKIEKEKQLETERKLAAKPPLRHLPADERNELLNGLKTNWGELQKEFLLLPMLTDTVPKIKRKTMLEKQLNDLEKDIDLLERNSSLYVCQDE